MYFSLVLEVYHPKVKDGFLEKTLSLVLYTEVSRCSGAESLRYIPRGFDDSELPVFLYDVSDKQTEECNVIWCHNKFGKNIPKIGEVVDFSSMK
jgi:hypothetical protein